MKKALSALSLCFILGMTACGNSSNSSTSSDEQTTQATTESTSDTGVSMGSIDTTKPMIVKQESNNPQKPVTYTLTMDSKIPDDLADAGKRLGVAEWGTVHIENPQGSGETSATFNGGHVMIDGDQYNIVSADYVVKNADNGKPSDMSDKYYQLGVAKEGQSVDVPVAFDHEIPQNVESVTMMEIPATQ